MGRALQGYLDWKWTVSATLFPYIELNPVRVNMVTHPSEYPWSSYRFNALGQNDDCMTVHLLYLQLGETVTQRQAAYRALLKSRISDKTPDQIRACTNKAWVLGNDRFREKIESQLNRRATPLPRGGARKSKRVRRDSDSYRVWPHCSSLLKISSKSFR